MLCKNTVLFDSRKSLALSGGPENYLKGPISLDGGPKVMRDRLNGRTNTRARNTVETMRPLIYCLVKCDHNYRFDPFYLV